MENKKCEHGQWPQGQLKLMRWCRLAGNEEQPRMRTCEHLVGCDECLTGCENHRGADGRLAHIS